MVNLNVFQNHDRHHSLHFERIQDSWVVSVSTELDPIYSPKSLDLQGDISTPCDVKVYHKRLCIN